MLDLFLSLILTGVISIFVKIYFSESGLGAFPVLTFLVIAVLSYMATAALDSVFHF